MGVVNNNLSAQVDFGALYPNETMPKHGFFNPQIKAFGGITDAGKPVFGIEAGMRLGDHLRVSWDGAFVGDATFGSHHTTGRITADIIPARTEFYQKTGLDFNVSAFAGWKNQAYDIGFEVEHSDGTLEGAILKKRMKFTYGGGAGISWNCSRHIQLDFNWNIYFKPTEKDFKNTKKDNIYVQVTNPEDIAKIEKYTYSDTEQTFTIGVRFCF